MTIDNPNLRCTLALSSNHESSLQTVTQSQIKKSCIFSEHPIFFVLTHVIVFEKLSDTHFFLRAQSGILEGKSHPRKV